MNLTYRKTLIVVAGMVAMGITSCKKFLDVNENPNGTTTVTDNLVLPSTQAAVGMVVGNNLQIFGGFYAQYWTQNPNSSQYKTIDQYQSSSASSDRTWGLLYNDALA